MIFKSDREELISTINQWGGNPKLKGFSFNTEGLADFLIQKGFGRIDICSNCGRETSGNYCERCQRGIQGVFS